MMEIFKIHSAYMKQFALNVQVAGHLAAGVFCSGYSFGYSFQTSSKDFIK